MAFARIKLLKRVSLRDRPEDTGFETLVRRKTRQAANKVCDAALPINHPKTTARRCDEPDLTFDHFGPHIIW